MFFHPNRGSGWIVRLDSAYLPIIQSARKITFARNTNPRETLVSLVIFIVGVLDLNVKFQTDLKSYPHSRKVTHIDALDICVQEFHAFDGADLP